MTPKSELATKIADVSVFISILLLLLGGVLLFITGEWQCPADSARQKQKEQKPGDMVCEYANSTETNAVWVPCDSSTKTCAADVVFDASMWMIILGSLGSMCLELREMQRRRREAAYTQITVV